MSRITTKKYLATANNLPLFPRDQDVFVKGARGGRPTVPKGQAVAYNLVTLKSIDATDLPLTDPFFFGVSVGESIQGISGDILDPCNIDDMSAVPARCGIPAIEDLYFKCVPCGKSYSIIVEVEDAHTDNLLPLGRGETWVVNGFSGACPCDSCDPINACEALACSFERSAKGESCDDDPFKYLQPRGDLGYKDAPFTLFALRPGYMDYNFCLCPEATDCEKCEHVTGITGISLDGTITTFENTVDPNNPTLTFVSQMDIILEEIKKVVEPIGGHVAVTGGGKCCQMQVKINSCQPVILQGPAGAIAACDTTDPFEGLVGKSLCKSCDPVAVDAGFTCGVRVIAHQVDWECDCYPNNNVKRNLSRSVRLYTGLENNFEEGAVLTRTIQKPRKPLGTGYIAMHHAQKAEQNGRGQKGLRYNVSRGNPPIPVKASKYFQTANIDECTQYCHIGINHHLAYNDNSFNNFKNYPQMESHILIPQGHVDTQTSVLAFINAVGALSTCPTKAVIDCGDNAPCDPTAVQMGVETMTVSGSKVKAKNDPTPEAPVVTASAKGAGTKVEPKK